MHTNLGLHQTTQILLAYTVNIFEARQQFKYPPTTTLMFLVWLMQWAAVSTYMGLKIVPPQNPSSLSFIRSA